MEPTHPRLLPAVIEGAQVGAAVRLSPLRQSRVEIVVPHGATVEEIIAQTPADPAGGYDVQVRIAGELLPREMWRRVRPRPGIRLVVDCVPRGGRIGKGILQIVIGIGLALFSFGALSGIHASLAGLTGGALVAGVAAAALTAAGGVYSLAAPAPTTPFDGDVPTSNESPTLQGRGNALRPYEAVARQFGRWRRFPTYAGRPYTELVGSDQYLRLLFSLGYGPLDVQDLKIGETPIDQITTEYQVLPGYDDDPDLIYYTQSVDELGLNVALIEGAPPSLRTTAADAHSASIDLAFPGGLIAFDEDDGRPGTVQVDFTVEYREAGTADPWVGVTAIEPLSPGVGNPSAGDFSIYGQVRGLTTRGIAWDFPAPGQYEIRIERVGETVHGITPLANATQSESTWSRLRAIRPGQRPRVPNLALIEMRIKATDQLGGLIEDFNVVSTSILPVWSDAEPLGDGWGPDNRASTNGSLEVTRNHAWAFAEVLRGKGAQRRVPNKRIDAAGLAAWATKIDDAGRTFDAVFDFETTIKEVLQDIAGAGRAAATLIDGRYGVVIDEVKPTIVTHFSPRDTSNFKSVRTFRDPIHAMRVNWVNPEAGYQPDELIVYADGYDESNATDFGRIDLLGMTDPEWAYRDGRYHLAAPDLRPEAYSFDMDVAALSLTQGDRFRFSNDVMLVGLTSGRIKSVTIQGDRVTSGTLDEGIEYDSVAGELGIQIRNAAGTLISGKLFTSIPNGSNFFVVITGGDIPPGEEPIAPGDLAVVGEFGRETADYLVVSVVPDHDMGATIEFVDYAPALFDVDTQPIPPRDPTITVPIPIPLQVPAVPAIESVRSDEAVLIVQPDGTVTPTIEVGVSVADGPVAATHIAVQHRIVPDVGPPGEWIAAPLVDARSASVRVGAVDAGSSYDIRARSVSELGRASNWAEALGHLVVGGSTPPPDVEGLRVETGSLAIWNYPQPPRDFAGFVIRHQSGSDANWGTGIPAHDGYLTESTFDLSTLPSGTRTVMVRAVDLGGNLSVGTAVIVKDIGLAAPENLVADRDFHALGFPGTIVDGTVEGGTGDLVADDDATGFWTNLANSFWTGVDAATFWTQPSLKMTYEGSWTIPPTDVPGRMVIDASITAGAWSVEYREQGATAWLRWPGAVQVDAAATYEFRFMTEASQLESRITALRALIDLPDKEETVADFVVAATGTVRLPIANTYRVIRQCLVTVQQDGNGGQNARIVDKDATNGPRLEVFDATGTRVAGLVDAQIRGY